VSRLAAWRAVLAEAAAALDFVPASWAAHLVTQTAGNSQRVAIVNQTFVRKFFHGASPVGHYVDKDTMIVGVWKMWPSSRGWILLRLFRTKSPCIFLPRG
jgi:hypothetical protein